MEDKVNSLELSLICHLCPSALFFQFPSTPTFLSLLVSLRSVSELNRRREKINLLNFRALLRRDLKGYDGKLTISCLSS
ncbi:hypothetical protein V6N11_059966 [Hibiscus sabdariffa]|uniref:Uncharacterized protein n=2 Tax=Hibiscus sabdariffa TaxID=183260 RepID=A0ABR2BHS9_9ROSI